MKSLPFVARAVALIVALAVPAVAGQAVPSATRIDVSKLGPQVGDRVPDFSLKDQTGTTRTLQSIMGRRGAVLVFVRSTEWCPYCKTQLVELQGRAASLQAQGLGIAVISYDAQEVHARFSQQRGITFPLLADVGSETIKKFGLLNPVPAMALGPDKDDPAVKALVQRYVSVVNPTARMVGIAFPGTFILDRQGRVTSRFFEDFYIERTTMANLMVRAGARNEEIAATKVSTGHLEVTTYTTDRDIAPGNRFSIVLEITPKPGIHVYAPGAKDYRVVTLDIPSSQPFLRADPITYPASEIYHFKPLDERVPVYQKPFRLVREVVLDGQPQAQAAYRGKDSLTISGTLEYQACDDRICFNPVALPLSWTVGLRPLVREPAPTQAR
jgi:peroxiredoxin